MWRHILPGSGCAVSLCPTELLGCTIWNCWDEALGGEICLEAYVCFTLSGWHSMLANSLIDHVCCSFAVTDGACSSDGWDVNACTDSLLWESASEEKFEVQEVFLFSKSVHIPENGPILTSTIFIITFWTFSMVIGYFQSFSYFHEKIDSWCVTFFHCSMYHKYVIWLIKFICLFLQACTAHHLIIISSRFLFKLFIIWK